MRITKIRKRWFECPEDPDKGRILIKHLTPGERQEILDSTMNQKIVYKTVNGQMTPHITAEPDKRLDKELTLEKTVLGWENFYDEHGVAMQFNKENLLKASRMIEGFDIFVIECRELLSSEIHKEKEGQEKN